MSYKQFHSQVYLYIHKRNENTSTKKLVFITLLIIDKKQKQPKCSPADEWIKCGIATQSMLSIKRHNRIAAVKSLVITSFKVVRAFLSVLQFLSTPLPSQSLSRMSLGDSSKPGVVSRSRISSLPKDGKLKAKPEDHQVKGSSPLQPKALIFAFSFPKEDAP